MGCAAPVSSWQKYADRVWEVRYQRLPRSGRPPGRWLWEESPNVWQPFDSDTGRRMEEAEKMGEHKLVFMLQSGQICEVNFATEKQTLLGSGIERRIRFKPIGTGDADADANADNRATPSTSSRAPPPAKPPPGLRGSDSNLGTWQWEASRGVWQAFEPHVERILLAARKYGRYRVVYCINGKVFEADFENNSQRNLSTGVVRHLRWKPVQQFQWEMKNGIWVDYEDEENDALIAGMLQGLPSVHYSARGFDYEVNLNEMKQENISLNAATIRHIRILGADVQSDEPAPSPRPAEIPTVPIKPRPAWQGQVPSGQRDSYRSPRPERSSSQDPAGREYKSPRPSSKERSPRPSSKEPSRIPKTEDTQSGQQQRGHKIPPRPAPPKAPSEGPSVRAAQGRPSAPAGAKQNFSSEGYSSAEEVDAEDGSAKKQKRWSFGGPSGPGAAKQPSPPPKAGKKAPPAEEPPPKAASNIPPGLELPVAPAAKRASLSLISELEALKSRPLADRKKAYRAACLRWHPDKNTDDEDTATEVFKFLQDLKDWYLKE